MIEMCSHYHDRSACVKPLTNHDKTRLQKTVKGIATSGLICIVFAYKQLNPNEERFAYEKGLTVLGIIGIRNPCKPGLKEAIDLFRLAGVDVKMITGENLYTAKAIAISCGILIPDVSSPSQVLEGETFARWTHDQERTNEVEAIRFMANRDRLMLVERLRSKGYVVGLAGNGTIDSPLLKEADFGLPAGILSVEVSKAVSEIVILDNDLPSIAKVMMLGRTMYNNIQKYCQFQLPATFAAMVIDFVCAVSTGVLPLTAAHLVWLNILMAPLGVVGLAIERPSEEVMRRPPICPDAPFVTYNMWRSFLGRIFVDGRRRCILSHGFEGLRITSSEGRSIARPTTPKGAIRMCNQTRWAAVRGRTPVETAQTKSITMAVNVAGS